MRCWRADGSGAMEIGAHDMGQGAWTALAQIAADALALDIEEIEFRSGTSDLPDAGIAAARPTPQPLAWPSIMPALKSSPGSPSLRPMEALAAVWRRQRRRATPTSPAAPDSRRANAAEQVWPIRYHPDLGQIALRAWSRQLNDGLGHIVCAARAGHRGPEAIARPPSGTTSGVRVRKFPITGSPDRPEGSRRPIRPPPQSSGSS
jgi:hypothetical protein